MDLITLKNSNNKVVGQYYVEHKTTNVVGLPKRMTAILSKIKLNFKLEPITTVIISDADSKNDFYVYENLYINKVEYFVRPDGLVLLVLES